MCSINECMVNLHKIAMNCRMAIAYRPARRFDQIPCWAEGFKHKYVTRILCRGRVWTKLFLTDHDGDRPNLSSFLFDVLLEYLSPVKLEGTDHGPFSKDLEEAFRHSNSRSRADATSLRRLVGHKTFDKMEECVKRMRITT